MASNPDSPQSLKVLSAVNSALAPAAKASRQVIDALEWQLEGQSPSQAQDAAVSAAVAHWEKVCGVPMDSSLLGDLRAEARERAERRRPGPPQMDALLNPPHAKSDVGYRLGLHLDGIEGTWHRLWALLSLTFQFGDTPTGNLDCENLRQQFEQALGRELQPSEWNALVDHAREHANGRRRGPSERG